MTCHYKADRHVMVYNPLPCHALCVQTWLYCPQAMHFVQNHLVAFLTLLATCQNIMLVSSKYLYSNKTNLPTPDVPKPCISRAENTTLHHSPRASNKLCHFCFHNLHIHVASSDSDILSSHKGISSSADTYSTTIDLRQPFFVCFSTNIHPSRYVEKE